MAKTVTVGHRRGGVGKTITALNLSAALGIKGKKVLTVDTDAQGNLTRCMLPWEMQDNCKTLIDAFKSESLEGCIYSSTAENVDIIPSHENLAVIDRIFEDVIVDKEYKLQDLLDTSELDWYDYIIVDSPPGRGLISTNALVASDTLLIPVESFFSVDGLLPLLKDVAQIQKRANPDLDVGYFLITLYDPRTKVGKSVGKIRDKFGERVLGTEIPRNITLSECTAANQAIYTYEPNCRGAKAYMELADELLEKWEGL